MPEWDEIAERHAKLVYGVAYRIVGRIQDAEDSPRQRFAKRSNCPGRGA